MRTQLRSFCKHFDTTVKPIVAPIDAVLGALQNTEPDSAGDELRSSVDEIRAELTALIDKVAQEQAYVVIFGPLKSGKSTLMNAISAAYVSEVSSLPAYPCLVFVQHGDEREFVAADYEGTTHKFAEATALRQRIEEEHLKLADRIRQTERAGDAFDPVEHLPSAIRRIDVKVPAENLKNSEAVLVDTPGLYTRMRFGYDRMTRDFRNAAACAIFVVKSDNLFLEQVFAEFDHLLSLFSRIFLVVNQDTAKRDVDPSGELVPSAEQKSPELIIKAFESLAMTAPLKLAMDEGRLRMYSVDLMNAASTALRGSRMKPGADRKAVESKLPRNFTEFRDDLAEYLASEDYILAFLGDSLSRAHGLIGELQILSDGDYAAHLRAERGRLESEKAAYERDLERVTTCLDQDWSPAFARFQVDLEAEVKRASRDQAARLARFMGATIDTWFLSSHSVQRLFDVEWQPLVQEYLDHVRRSALRCFEQSCAQDGAGLDIPAEIAATVRSFDVDTKAARQTAAKGLGPASKPFEELLPLDVDGIPIRRGVFDVVAFRSVDNVRDRLFGPPDRSDKKIPAKTKKSRLGEPAKHYMRQSLTQFQKQLSERTVIETIRRFGADLQQATVEELTRALREHEPEVRAAIGRLDQEIAEIVVRLEPLERLHAVATDGLAKVHALSSQYASSAPDLLAATVDRDPVLRPRPARQQASGPVTGRRRRARRVDPAS